MCCYMCVTCLTSLMDKSPLLIIYIPCLPHQILRLTSKCHCLFIITMPLRCKLMPSCVWLHECTHRQVPALLSSTSVLHTSIHRASTCLCQVSLMQVILLFSKFKGNFLIKTCKSLAHKHQFVSCPLTFTFVVPSNGGKQGIYY